MKWRPLVGNIVIKDLFSSSQRPELRDSLLVEFKTSHSSGLLLYITAVYIAPGEHLPPETSACVVIQ